MNRITRSIFLNLSFLMLFSSGASAYVISGSEFNGTNVGDLDIWKGSQKITGSSNPTAETNWVKTTLDTTIDYVTKTEDVTYYATDTQGVFAFQLQSEPGYFLIKNAKWWALFENKASSDWGVVDFLALDSGFKLPDLKNMQISHVTEFGKFTHQVSEPANLFLLIIGLVGLVVARRRYHAL